MIKTIDTSVVTPEMILEFWGVDDCYMPLEDGAGIGIARALQAAPEVKAEPDVEPTIWTHFSALAIQNPWTAMFIKPGENPIDKIAMFGEQAGQKYGETRMEAIAELLGESLRMEAAPAAYDLVERIRALEIAEPMGWMDRCHNSVVAKIVELIEGAK